MLNLFRMMADRLKALFLADVALDLEAQLASRQADRTAELLVQAEQHDRHGFPTVAAQLRARAEALSLERPLAGVLPALAHWRDDDIDPDGSVPTPTVAEDTSQINGHLPRPARLPAARKKEARP